MPDPTFTPAHGQVAQEMPPLLLTERQAAKLLNLSTRTLFSLRRAGELPFLKCGEKVLYDLVDLRAWINTRKAATAERGKL
jgi:excisionase family DNA binding protein